MKRSGYKKKIAGLAVVLAVLLLLLSAVLTLMISTACTERYARVLPSYPKRDISSVLARENWTEEDYDLLYHQTGLGKPALDDLKHDPAAVLAFQERFFYRGTVEHETVAITTPRDKLANGATVPVAPLMAGDIILTSSPHTFGWRNGHAALILEPETYTTLESFSPSDPSGYGDLSWFEECSNYLVLRLKSEYRDKIDPAAVAADAEARLTEIPYDLTVGVLSPKDQCKDGKKAKKTHCAHVVWQAYKNFGIDIDSNGGAVVTARDIARSEYFEVVQVNGFDPDKLW